MVAKPSAQIMSMAGSSDMGAVVRAILEYLDSQHEQNPEPGRGGEGNPLACWECGGHVEAALRGCGFQACIKCFDEKREPGAAWGVVAMLCPELAASALRTAGRGKDSEEPMPMPTPNPETHEALFRILEWCARAGYEPIAEPGVGVWAGGKRWWIDSNGMIDMRRPDVTHLPECTVRVPRAIVSELASRCTFPVAPPDPAGGDGRIFVLEKRHSASPDGPWSAPEVTDVVSGPATDWSEPRDNKPGWWQSRVVECIRAAGGDEQGDEDGARRMYEASREHQNDDPWESLTDDDRAVAIRAFRVAKAIGAEEERAKSARAVTRLAEEHQRAVEELKQKLADAEASRDNWKTIQAETIRAAELTEAALIETKEYGARWAEALQTLAQEMAKRKAGLYGAPIGDSVPVVLELLKEAESAREEAERKVKAYEVALRELQVALDGDEPAGSEQALRVASEAVNVYLETRRVPSEGGGT